MQLAILILLGLIGGLVYLVFHVITTRSRLRELEDEARRLQARVNRLEVEAQRTRRPADAAASSPDASEDFATTPAPAPIGSPRPAEPPSWSSPPVPASFPDLPESPTLGGETAAAPPTVPSYETLPPLVPPALAQDAATGKPVGAAARPEFTGTAPKRPRTPAIPTINWEQFMGVKLFSWIGGFALFLAVAFFVKYSFDNGWISPELRVALGYLTGLGLLVGGVFLSRRPTYLVASHALCGTGVVILYAVTFAAHAAYHLIENGATFALMTLVTAAAFTLADRMRAMPVAILGMLGGFLTPPLLSTGVDRPFGLFAYIALLDIGLMAVALRRRWAFLVGLGAVGTVLMELGWAGKFFGPEKLGVALAIFATFNLLFLAVALLERRLGRTELFTTISALALPFVTFLFCAGMMAQREIGERPGMIFLFLLAAELPLLALVLSRPGIHVAHVGAGAAAFFCLALWTSRHLTNDLLNWALAGTLGFALLHSVFPVVLQRFRPEARHLWAGHLFPPLALLLVMVPMFHELELTWLLWPVILLIDVLAILLAILSGALLGVLGVLGLTLLVTILWLFHAPADATSLWELLFVVGGFAAFFFVVGLAFGERWFAKLERLAASAGGASSADGSGAGGGVPGAVSNMARWLGGGSDRAQMTTQVSACAAILPFLLLIMAVTRLPLANPSPVYGLAAVLLGMSLVVVRRTGVNLLLPVGLGCVLALQYAWATSLMRPVETAGITLAWNLGFAALFLVFPFFHAKSYANRILPWATSALSGPLHFFIVYNLVKWAWPNGFMGLLPALFALPMMGALAFVVRSMPVTGEDRNRLLAWFGGSALFFITLIFPIQFEKQWITVGWALEGLALLWLFRRVPHAGLRALGVVLLAVAFLRLALNPAVFEYHPRSETRIWNWYLYGYGIATACLLGGARLLAPPRNRVFSFDMLPILYGLGTVLAFLLLNIEIADWFSSGSNLTFEFNASFGQDMTYSIAWGLFAFLLLALGFRNEARGARWAGMGLLVVTLLKLFLHDLWRLGGLYRVGSLVGLAVVLLVVSIIYQRFLAQPARPSGPAAPSPETPSTPGT